LIICLSAARYKTLGFVSNNSTHKKDKAAAIGILKNTGQPSRANSIAAVAPTVMDKTNTKKYFKNVIFSPSFILDRKKENINQAS
jgi:hypothetical protein